MISDGIILHVKTCLRGITSKHDGDFYCLNCFHTYSTKDKSKKHKDVCEKHDYYYYLKMPKEVNKILKDKSGEKSMKRQFIYPDLQSLLEKMSTCHNNPQKSWTTKINKHTPSGYSLFTKIFIWCYKKYAWLL